MPPGCFPVTLLPFQTYVRPMLIYCVLWHLIFVSFQPGIPMYRLLHLTLILLITVPMSVAQDPPPLLDRELFFGNPEYSGAQLSPDGSHLTFIRPHNGVMNIWIRETDASMDTARPLTADERPVFGYFWSNDGRYVLYVQDQGGDENFHVFRIDPTATPDAETGVPQSVNLTPVEGARAAIYSLPRNNPDIALVGLNDRDAAWHDLYEINIATGERTLLLLNDRQITSWLFDHDGVAHLASRSEMSTGGTEILSVADGVLGEVIYSCTVTESCGAMMLHPDGEHAYAITNHNRDLIEFILLDLETGEETFLERHPEGEVDFTSAVFSSVDDRLLVTYYIEDRLSLHFHDDDLAADFEFLRSELPDAQVLPGSRTDDERLMLVNVSSDVDPGSVYLFDRDARTVSHVYTSRPELPTEYLAEMQSIRYSARDGLEIPAYLTLPKSVSQENLPLIVWPHGGPWARDIWGYDSFAQFMANRGYAVFQPNFRGSTGYGKAFLDAGNAEWGTGYMQHDITDGIQHLVDQGIVDPARVGIGGISYGGYATLAGLSFTPDIYAAGASIVGPSNLITLLNSIPPYWEAMRLLLYERMGDPNDPEGRELLESQSPFFNADHIQAPLLVVQGANDPRVIQYESDQIVVAVRDRGGDVEYLVAPDEGHGFRDETNNMAMIVALENFFGEYLGGRVQEDVADHVAQRLVDLTVDPATVELREETDTSDLQPASFDGTQIEAVSLRYQSVMEVMGQRLEMEQTSVAEEVDYDGRAAWRLVSNAMMMGQAISDTSFVDRETLRPFARTLYQGPQQVDIVYGENDIQLAIAGMGEMNASFEGEIATDGVAFDVGLGTLPLADDFAATIEMLDMMSGVTMLYVLRVTGSEEIEVPAGTFDTWVVELQPADGSAPRVMHVAKAEPQLTVRTSIPLPPQAGGGTMTSELLSVE